MDIRSMMKSAVHQPSINADGNGDRLWSVATTLNVQAALTVAGGDSDSVNDPQSEWSVVHRESFSRLSTWSRLIFDVWIFGIHVDGFPPNTRSLLFLHHQCLLLFAWDVPIQTAGLGCINIGPYQLTCMEWDISNKVLYWIPIEWTVSIKMQRDIPNVGYR